MNYIILSTLFFILALSTESREGESALKKESIANYMRTNLGFSIVQLENYPITSLRTSYSRVLKIEQIELKSQSYKKFVSLEIHRPFIEKDFLSFEKAHMNLTYNLYLPQSVPYHGAITDRIECNTKKVGPFDYLVSTPLMTFHVLEGAVSKRFVFGVCDFREHFYQGALIIFKGQDYYALMKLFVSKEDYLKNRNYFKDLLKSVRK